MKSLSLWSIRGRLIWVRDFFKFLEKENIVFSNPAKTLNLPKLEKTLPRNTMTEEEITEFMSLPDISTKHGLRNRAIFELFYSTGIRRQELINLNISDIDFNSGVLAVIKGKGGKDRFVPIGKEALYWFAKYLKEARPDLIKNFMEKALFISVRGKRIGIDGIRHALTNCMKKSSIKKKISIHSFRHTFATHMLKTGCDVRHLQTMLGHECVESTEIYTKVEIQDLIDVVRKCHPRGKK